MIEQEKKGLVPELRFAEFKDAGEWVGAKLGEKDISAFIKERMPLDQLTLKNYISTENILPDYAGVASAKKLPSTGSFTRYKNGDILISNIRPYLKKVWMATNEGATSNDIIVIRAKSKVKSSFLTHLLINDEFINYVMKGAKGVKMPRGDISLMKEYPVAIPANPKEQQKIADCLTSVDDFITAQSQKLIALKAHKEGLMQQLFPAEGETTPKRRFPEFLDKREWDLTLIRDVGEIITGSTPSTIKPEYYGGDRLFVSPADISDQRFVEKTKTTLTELGFSETRPVKPGSILFVCIGSTIGKVVQNRLECATNQQINAVVPHEGYSSAFVYYSLEKNSKRISGLAGNHAVPIINKTSFGAVEIRFPELPEQKKIAGCLSSVDELITAQTQKIDALKAHKKGLMLKLLSVFEEASQ